MRNARSGEDDQGVGVLPTVARRAVRRHRGVGVVLWADLFIRVIGPRTRRQHFPGSVYWVGAAPRLGRPRHGTARPRRVRRAAERMGATPDLGFLPFAPAAVIPLLPLGLLPEAAAYFTWTLFGVLALFAAVAILLVALRPPPMLALLLVALLPLFHPLRANFAVGQAYAFVLLALVLHAMISYAVPSRRRLWAEGIGGLSAAIVVVLKTNYGLVILLPALIARRWRLLGVTAAFVLVAALPDRAARRHRRMERVGPIGTVVARAAGDVGHRLPDTAQPVRPSAAPGRDVESVAGCASAAGGRRALVCLDACPRRRHGVGTDRYPAVHAESSARLIAQSRSLAVADRSSRALSHR